MFLNAASDDLITGTSDGFIICWKIVSAQRQVNIFEGFVSMNIFRVDYSEIIAYWSYKSSIVYYRLSIHT